MKKIITFLLLFSLLFCVFAEQPKVTFGPVKYYSEEEVKNIVINVSKTLSDEAKKEIDAAVNVCKEEYTAQIELYIDKTEEQEKELNSLRFQKNFLGTLMLVVPVVTFFVGAGLTFVIFN